MSQYAYHVVIVAPLPVVSGYTPDVAVGFAARIAAQLAAGVDVAAWHAPAVHTNPAPHALPHEPQLSASEVMLASQPSAAEPLQSTKPGMHIAAQTPDRQSAFTFAPPGHRVPHMPQFCGST
jgi:hypothetical protein